MLSNKKFFNLEYINSSLKPDSSRIYFLLLIIFVVFYFLLRLIYACNLPVNNDEGRYIYDAYLITEGFVPFEDYLTRSPVFIYSLSFFIRIFGNTLIAGRLLSIIASLLTAVVLYKIGSNFFRKKIGIIAAILFLVVPYSIKISTFVITEPLQVFFVSVAIFYFFKGLKNKKIAYYFLNGLFLALAIFTRRSAILFIFFELFFTIFLTKDIVKKKLTNILGMAGGLFAITIPLVFYFLTYISFDKFLSLFGGFTFSYYFSKNHNTSFTRYFEMSDEFIILWNLMIEMLVFVLPCILFFYYFYKRKKHDFPFQKKLPKIMHLLISFFIVSIFTILLFPLFLFIFDLVNILNICSFCFNLSCFNHCLIYLIYYFIWYVGIPLILIFFFSFFIFLTYKYQSYISSASYNKNNDLFFYLLIGWLIVPVSFCFGWFKMHVNYFFELLPALCLISAISILLINKIITNKKIQFQFKKSFFGLIIFALGFSFLYNFLNPYPGSWSNKVISETKGYLESNIRESDEIFTAALIFPYLLEKSITLNITHFGPSTKPLLPNSKEIQNYLTEEQVRYAILDQLTKDTYFAEYPDLSEYIKDNYHIVKKIIDEEGRMIVIYERNKINEK